MPDERALGDVPIVDASVPPTPEGFDLAAFVAGIRPTRRAVQLFPQAHLIARLEELAARIDASAQDADVDDLVEEFDRVRSQFQAGIWFTVEKWSSERAKRFEDETVRTLGLVRKPRGGGQRPQLSDEDQTTVTLHRLAGQIVEPAGVTYDMLRSLEDHNEGELAKLMVCMTAANTELAESVEVLTRDFSSRRSTRSATQAS